MAYKPWWKDSRSVSCSFACIWNAGILLFQHYNALRENGPESDSYLQSCLSAQKRILSNLPQLPFSHLYVASKLYDKLPKGCTLHLGILSPLRSWGYFPLDKSIEVYCNEGGFGIDGNMSSLLGASLACPDKLFFGVVGDLSFFMIWTC